MTSFHGLVEGSSTIWAETEWKRGKQISYRNDKGKNNTQKIRFLALDLQAETEHDLQVVELSLRIYQPRLKTHTCQY